MLRYFPRETPFPVKTFMIGITKGNNLLPERTGGTRGTPRRGGVDDASHRRPRSASCPRRIICRTSRSPILFASRYISCLQAGERECVVVCQVGEGADELFCGYPYSKTMLDHQALDDFRFQGY